MIKTIEDNDNNESEIDIPKEDRNRLISEASMLYDKASMQEQENNVIENIRELVYELVSRIDSIEKNIGINSKDSKEANQDPLNNPVDIQMPQGQPDFMQQLMAATGSQNQQQPNQ